MTMVTVMTCNAGEKMDDTNKGGSNRSLAELAGKPADIAPWTYAWRADLAVQKQPEAYFIPRRLDRLDKVYRTAYYELPEQELKSIYYDMQDVMKPLLAKPKGKLHAGLLWTGGLADYEVQLHWPADRPIPTPSAVEVRVYPTAFGWFGWTVDKVLANPTVSADQRTWTYKSDPTATMDTSYSRRVPAATEMVAVFCEDAKTPVPGIGIVGPSIGAWKRMDVEIEWGFQAGTQKDMDGSLEPYVAVIGPIAPLTSDTGTTMTGDHSWRSRAAGDTRRGIVVPLLYAPNSRPGLDSRITVHSESGNFTFSVRDLENGSILTEKGVFVTRVGSGQTAQKYAMELAAKKPRSVRQMTREHREAASWDELMQEARLWTCPEGTAVPAFPPVAEPPMQVQLSDERWTGAWRAASAQLQGKHLWGGLAYEVARVAHNMDMIGLHEEADKVYEHFLKAPGAKSDGDYTDGVGALEWATAMRHDMGYNHDGTHASTGRMLFAMAERHFLTGDKEWFGRNRVRLQAAADWIIRQRTLYMKDVPNRDSLFVKGLMPPYMLGDYVMPSCDWRWYYVDNALSLQGVQRFADALTEFDPAAGQKYHNEAEAYRKDIRRAAEREAELSPVRLGLDGMYHSYIARMAYARGLTGPELGAPQFPGCDLMTGALPLAEPFAALDASDPRMVDTLDVTEEMGTYLGALEMTKEIGMSAATVRESIEARKQKGLPTEDTWFWHCFVILPKASHNANIYLLQDDVPNFLRFWINSYATVVGADGRLWEHSHLGGYTECATPDNGTAGWFMENFRNLLVMEEGQSLWVARATPRSWLEQGKKIAVSNAPTAFGTLAYEIISDADNGTIAATIEIPNRSQPKSVILRFRHPKSAPIKSVTVNGKPWSKINTGKETIELTGLTGKAAVVASY